MCNLQIKAEMTPVSLFPSDSAVSAHGHVELRRQIYISYSDCMRKQVSTLLLLFIPDKTSRRSEGCFFGGGFASDWVLAELCMRTCCSGIGDMNIIKWRKLFMKSMNQVVLKTSTKKAQLYIHIKLTLLTGSVCKTKTKCGLFFHCFPKVIAKISACHQSDMFSFHYYEVWDCGFFCVSPAWSYWLHTKSAVDGGPQQLARSFNSFSGFSENERPVFQSVNGQLFPPSARFAKIGSFSLGQTCLLLSKQVCPLTD